MSNALSVIEQLQPQTYYKTSEMYDANHNFIDPSGMLIETGLIAQDVFKTPQLKHTFGSDHIDGLPSEYDASGNPARLKLSYNNIHVFNIQAVKELYAIVKTQQTEIQDLKARILALES